MTATITPFERSPDRGRGLARDMRVRWAFEEVGQAYEVRRFSFGAMKEPAHRALHPFGQIPTYEEGDLVLFESGPSCSISRSTMRACCLTTRMPGRARLHNGGGYARGVSIQREIDPGLRSPMMRLQNHSMGGLCSLGIGTWPSPEFRSLTAFPSKIE